MSRSSAKPFAAFAWWSLSALLLLVPGSATPSGPDWLIRLAENGGDKLVHLALFVGLAWSLRSALGGGNRSRLMVIGLCVAWAVASELAQIWVPHRDADAIDLAADLVGALVGLGLRGWWSRRGPAPG